jgi:hypothetical protein
MASDGSQPLFNSSAVAASGGGGAAAVPAAAAARRAATGVWDGPAPLGWRTPAGAPVPVADPPFDAAKEPRNTLLANGVRLPLLGVAAVDAAGVECVPARSVLAHATHARTHTRVRNALHHTRARKQQQRR